MVEPPFETRMDIRRTSDALGPPGTDVSSVSPLFVVSTGELSPLLFRVSSLSDRSSKVNRRLEQTWNTGIEDGGDEIRTCKGPVHD